MKLILATLLCLCPALAEATTTIFVHIDSRLNGRDQEIWAGFRMWSNVCDVDFVRVKQREAADLAFTAMRDNPKTKEIETEEYMGRCWLLWDVIELNLECPDLKTTTCHELGHYLGRWEHDERDRNAIMWHEYSPHRKFSKSEIRRARKIFGIRGVPSEDTTPKNTLK